MTRLDGFLQPGEVVVWRNRPGLGLGVWLLLYLVFAALFLAALIWFGGGWDALRESPGRLIPLAVVVVVGGQPMRDGIVVTERRLLLTRGLFRRTVAEIARSDIRSVELGAHIPYYGQVVAINLRDATSVRLYRPGEAGAAAYGRPRIETVLRADAVALRHALMPEASPWGHRGRR